MSFQKYLKKYQILERQGNNKLKSQWNRKSGADFILVVFTKSYKNWTLVFLALSKGDRDKFHDHYKVDDPSK